MQTFTFSLLCWNMFSVILLFVNMEIRTWKLYCTDVNILVQKCNHFVFVPRCYPARELVQLQTWSTEQTSPSLPQYLCHHCWRGAFWRPCDGSAQDVPVDDLAGIVVLASHLRKLWSMQVAFTTFSATSGETHSTRRYTLHWDASMPNAHSTILRTWERRVLNTFFSPVL